jgi:hypothetical protein
MISPAVHPRVITVFADLIRAGLLEFTEAIDAIARATLLRDPVPDAAALDCIEAAASRALADEIDRPELHAADEVRSALRRLLAERAPSRDLLSAAHTKNNGRLPDDEVEVIVVEEIEDHLAALSEARNAA